MSAKKALIVDDSKSARAFLSRILEKYEVAVDTAENAEQALDYLGDHRPDVIFMDHLMPGMDGFQALQSIKNNPRTAMIPIMMYTSQEGELYLGQARALGAIGVLPKQIKPADVSRVLYQLRILPERRGAEAQTTFTPLNSPSTTGTRPALRETGETPYLRVVSNNASAPSTTDLRSLVESVVEQHMGDLHRSVSASLDAQSERLLGDVRIAVQDAIAQMPATPNIDDAFAAPSARRSSARWGWAAAAAAALAATVLAALWWRESADRRDIAAQLLASRQEAVALAGRLNAALQTSRESAAMAAAAPQTGDNTASMRSLAVPYGEAPLSGDRVESLRGLLAKLQAEKFRGTVVVTNFPGRFCLQKSGDGFEVAADATLVGRCDSIGNPFDDALPAAQREPLAFANLAGSVRQQTGGAILLELIRGSADSVATAYPARSDKLTAGEWNRAAAANNRVEIKLQPAEGAGAAT